MIRVSVVGMRTAFALLLVACFCLAESPKRANTGLPSANAFFGSTFSTATSV